MFRENTFLPSLQVRVHLQQQQQLANPKKKKYPLAFYQMQILSQKHIVVHIGNWLSHATREFRKCYKLLSTAIGHLF